MGWKKRKVDQRGTANQKGVSGWVRYFSSFFSISVAYMASFFIELHFLQLSNKMNIPISN